MNNPCAHKTTVVSASPRRRRPHAPPPFLLPAVVLLARDTAAGAPALKDLDVDMAAWQPLIEDRAFVDWLVKHPSREDAAGARRLTADEAGRLEELWRAAPGATLEDLVRLPAAEEGPLPVALRYDDAGAHEALFGALVTAEADHDRATKEAQMWQEVAVHWSLGLNKRHVARFYFPRDSSSLRLMIGARRHHRRKRLRDARCGGGRGGPLFPNSRALLAAASPPPCAHHPALTPALRLPPCP